MNAPQDHERFQSLLNGHKGIVYKVCRSWCPNPDDREDLAQEIITQLWLSFGRFDERGRFSTWMYRIALNVAISFYRRESTRRRHVISNVKGVLDVADDSIAQSEEIRLLYQFIGKLDEWNKALVLLYLDGNTYQEIADVLGISQTNVATKIGRLKHSMKQELSGSRG